MHPASYLGFRDELEKIAADHRVVGALLGGGLSVARSAVREHAERSKDIRAKLGPKRTERIRKHRLLGYGAHAVGSAALGAAAGHAWKTHGGKLSDLKQTVTNKAKDVKHGLMKDLEHSVSKGVKGGDVEGQVERGIRKGIPGGEHVHKFFNRNK